MKKRLVVLLALVSLSIPAICSATPPIPGAYVSGFAGIAIPTDTDVTGSVNDRIEFDPSAYVGGTGGFDFGFLRLEGELSYKHGEIARVIEVGGTRYRDIDGNLGVVAMMGNAFLDLHNLSPITPYLGGGIGFATIHQEDTFGTSTETGQRFELYRSDDDTVFAYQAGAGLEIALSRLLSLDLGYRYFRTLRARFTDDGNDHALRFESHNLAAGIRVKF